MNNFSKFKKAAISKSEMKAMKGGSGTCAYTGDGSVIRDLSKGQVLFLLDMFGGRWCCDSCGSASWL